MKETLARKIFETILRPKVSILPVIFVVVQFVLLLLPLYFQIFVTSPISTLLVDPWWIKLRPKSVYVTRPAETTVFTIWDSFPGSWTPFGWFQQPAPFQCRKTIKVWASWWRQSMETFSALLAICAGNSPVSGEFPAQSQWRGALMFSLICASVSVWENNLEAGDLRRHRAHYDVSVMCFMFSGAIHQQNA